MSDNFNIIICNYLRIKDFINLNLSKIEKK